MPTKNYLLLALLRNACLLLIGVLLVVFSDQAPKWIVMGCGVLFMLPGLVTLLAMFTDDQDSYMPMVPFTAGGSILFGIYLLCFPNDFIGILLYTLAGVLIMFGTLGCFSVWRARRTKQPISAWHFLFPVLLFIAGIVVLVLEHDVLSLPFLIIGYALIFYAPIQMVTSIAISRSMKRIALAEAPEEVMVEVKEEKEPAKENEEKSEKGK